MTVRQRGWAEMKNGELLRLAQKEFDVFLTMDRGIAHQQNIKVLDLAVVQVRAKSNRIEDLIPLVGETKGALRKARPGTLVRVAAR